MQGYENIDEREETAWSKISRSTYLIISISFLTHTFSLIYSLITYQKQSAAFISIIVSATSCFFISSSHLTIYGISVLGTLYLSMIKPFFNMYQMFYIVALCGIFMLPFWKVIHSIGSIFRCLPGRIHASLVFGIVLIVLSRVPFSLFSFSPWLLKISMLFSKCQKNSSHQVPLKFSTFSFNLSTWSLSS